MHYIQWNYNTNTKWLLIQNNVDKKSENEPSKSLKKKKKKLSLSTQISKSTKIISERGTAVYSVAQSCPTLCDPVECSTPDSPVHHQLPESTQSWWCPSSWWCHPTISFSVIPFSSCPPSFPASESFQMRQFYTSGGHSIGWSFSFSISPSSEYSGLISFRMDWFDLLAVLQNSSSKASILQRSAFFIVQPSHHTWLLEKP